MLSLRKLLTLLIIALPLLLGLLFYNFPAKHSVSTPQIIEAYQSTVDFSEANQLKYQQDYPRAIAAYETALQTPTLELADSIYLINQTLYCQLLMNQSAGVESKLQWLESKLGQLPPALQGLQADYYYNQSRYHFLQKEKELALSNAHQALRQYYQYYPKGHLKIGQTLTLLALIHLKDGNLTDSIHHYSLLANDFFLNQPDLKDYDWENEYIMGYCSLLKRAHEVGEYHGRATLQKIENLPFDNPWLAARIANLLGNLLKKQADESVYTNPTLLKEREVKKYWIADSLFQKAIEIGTLQKDVSLMEFYTDWIINVSRFEDDKYFFQAIETSKKFFRGTSEWDAHYNRLLGYYYRYRKGPVKENLDKSIKYYTSFVKISQDYPQIDYRIFADAYYNLRYGNKKKKKFGQSAAYAKKSLLLYDCISERVDILSLDAIDQIDSTNRYCLVVGGFFAVDLFEKYKTTKQLEDLTLANAYFDFVRKYSFKSLLAKDEDAFLTFQSEAGNRIFEKAVVAAGEAWKITKQPIWLDKIFDYMEHLKSMLLYRDMLKGGKLVNNEYSLNDSIRILQGQVNQLLFTLSKGEKLSNNDLRQNNLIKQLNILESRRSKRLGTFKTKTYQQPIQLKNIQAQLTNKKGIVSYFHTQHKLLGIYTDRDTILYFEQDKDYFEYKQTLALFTQSILQSSKLLNKDLEKYLTNGYKTYKELILPFAHRLSQIDQLIIIPDGELNAVPFEALLSQPVPIGKTSLRNLPYLLHQVSTVYTSSWKVFQVNQLKIEHTFNNKKVGFWTSPSLVQKNGLEEVHQSVKQYFKEDYQLFIKKKDGKIHFAENHAKFDILHLLLHAKSSKSNRYENFIQFGENKSDYLYGFELYNMLFQAQLLILASCESATGVPIRGEGTFSLARSFINSGIPEVIAAQYAIPQTTTAPLLREFYKQLNEGHKVATALHLAKLNYLQMMPKERHAHPRFWAGMVVYN